MTEPSLRKIIEAMRIFESQSRYALSVELRDAEALLYREVFRTQQPVAIPEFGNKKFIIRDMSPYEGEGAPENAWRLVIEQVAPENMAQPADSNELDQYTIPKYGGEF